MQTRDFAGRKPLAGRPILLALLCFLVSLGAEAARWKPPTEAEKQIVEDPSKSLVGAVYLEVLQESVFRTFHVWVRAKILSKNGFDIGTVEDIATDADDIEGRTIGPTPRYPRRISGR